MFSEGKDNRAGRALLSLLSDAVDGASEKRRQRFIHFLDENELQTAAAYLKSRSPHTVWGGYVGARRAQLCVHPEDKPPEPADFPLAALRVRNRSKLELAHRDVLGALMSLGIKRETVGDIVIGSPDIYVFTGSTVAPFVLQNLSQIGGAGVDVCVADDARHITFEQHYEPLRITLSSARLDAVTARLCGLARGRAQELISAGLVKLHGEVCERVDREVGPGDELSVRGYGRFRIDRDAGLSKKGRAVLMCSRYL